LVQLDPRQKAVTLEIMPGSRIKLVILDDDVQVRKALMRLFEMLKYNVRSYASAGDFLRTLNGDEPECLIADLQMPVMTGLELLSHLRQIGRHIPTIIMTGFDEPNMRENCLDAGAAAYFLKPVRKQTLVAAVDDAIRDSLGGRTPSHDFMGR
jgi:FixJ family two-component response regulator